VQRIGPADLVTIDQVDAGIEPAPQHFHLGGIVLAVAVGVEDELASRAGESAAQRSAVTAVLLVMDDPDLRIRARELVEDLGRVVATAVVHDDHLVVRRERPRRPQRRDHEARDGPAVVVGGKEHTQTRRGPSVGHEMTLNLIG
jgi:hypothetical protein